MISPNVIKRFLVAKSPVELERQQLALNKLFNTSFEYDIVQAKNGKWYAWFPIDVEVSQSLLNTLRVPRGAKK